MSERDWADKIEDGFARDIDICFAIASVLRSERIATIDYLRAQLATVIRERDELANWKAASERAHADRIAVETQILRNRIDRNKGHE